MEFLVGGGIGITAGFAGTLGLMALVIPVAVLCYAVLNANGVTERIARMFGFLPRKGDITLTELQSSPEYQEKLTEHQRRARLTTTVSNQQS